MTHTNHLFFIRFWGLLTICLLFPSQGALAANDLHVTIEGVKSPEGRIYVALQHESSKNQFPDQQQAISGIWRDVKQEGVMRFIFADIKPGLYAVAAYHDANGDGKLNRNISGVPREGIGFSKDATSSFGSPSFEKAAFTFDSQYKTIRFTLDYSSD